MTGYVGPRQVMKATQGKANPGMVNQLLKDELILWTSMSPLLINQVLSS